MARAKIGLSGGTFIETKPKKTRQGSGKNTKYAASSRNSAKKRYRGQGRWGRPLFLPQNKYWWGIETPIKVLFNQDGETDV